MHYPKKLGLWSTIELRRKGMFLHMGHSYSCHLHGLVSSAVAAVKERDASLLKHLAKEFNLTYTAFGSAITEEDGPSAGALTLTDAWGTALEPAPITPTSEDSVPWQ